MKPYLVVRQQTLPASVLTATHRIGGSIHRMDTGSYSPAALVQNKRAHKPCSTYAKYVKTYNARGL